MSGYPANGNISADPGDRLCYNCRGEGWVTVRLNLNLKARTKIEAAAGGRSYPNRIECPICKGAGVRPRMSDGNQLRMFP